MGFQLRKLASDPTPEDICDFHDCEDGCSSTCVKICPQICPPHSKFPTKYLKRRSGVTRRPSQREETTETRDEFLDEDHGPIVDHHIWYINTVGLQPSIVNSIAICKYVKGEGLVEGTECSVCLTEFEEDETLRLLPKCSHAFHVPCIDTWLRSHTNCPMCRAPIVSNMADRGPSTSEVNIEGTQVAIMEDDEESVRETEGGSGTSVEDELGVENEGNNTGESSGSGVLQPVRRSVSMDSVAASEISLAIANNGSNLDNELGKEKESSLRIVSRRSATGNQGLLRLIFMKRSFSCNGKFSLPISNNNEKPNPNRDPPMRSF